MGERHQRIAATAKRLGLHSAGPACDCGSREAAEIVEAELGRDKSREL